MNKKVPRNAFWNYFEDLDDPRDTGRNFTYSLESVVLLAVIGICCDQNSFTRIVRFLTMQWDYFEKYFPGHKTPPSRSTFQRVFRFLKPEEFEKCFIRWTESLPNKDKASSKGNPSPVVAIDGKTIRNSGHGTERPVHLVGAWASETGLLLGQVATAEKSNEIEAIPRLLEMLDLTGCVVTIDAMGCQKKIAKAILDANADYLLAAKANHKTMYGEIKGYFSEASPDQNNIVDFHEESNKGHGRIETRRCWVTTDIDWFEDKSDWPGLSMFVMVKSTRIVKGKESTHKRYYISSLEKASAKEVLQMTREHWGIENKLHWVMDVSFGEDKACIRDKICAHNIAATKRIAINALKSHPDYPGTPSGARMSAAFNPSFRETLLKSMC